MGRLLQWNHQTSACGLHAHVNCDSLRDAPPSITFAFPVLNPWFDYEQAKL
ncbi:MAG: hypothetical protein LUC35_08020 [Clostridiales bacterium]|nr:hypothetical protein [Clostridiales bacterium]